MKNMTSCLRNLVELFMSFQTLCCPVFLSHESSCLAVLRLASERKGREKEEERKRERERVCV